MKPNFRERRTQDFSLTHAGIHPQESLPAQTVVELGKFGALAGAIGAKLGAEDAQHRSPAFRSRPGALLRHAVDRAALLVILQLDPEEKSEPLGILIAGSRAAMLTMRNSRRSGRAAKPTSSSPRAFLSTLARRG